MQCCTIEMEFSLLTLTYITISCKSNVACTNVTSDGVCAICIRVTIIQLSFTLRNVCNKICHHFSTQECLCKTLIVHTCTVEPISFKTLPTCAVEAAICVSAVGIWTACMGLQFTLIDICRMHDAGEQVYMYTV